MESVMSTPGVQTGEHHENRGTRKGPGEEAGLGPCCAGEKWKDSGQKRELEHRHGLGIVSTILDERDGTRGESTWEEGSRDGVAPRALTHCPVSSHGKCVG